MPMNEIFCYRLGQKRGGGGGGASDEDWIGDGNTHIWISLSEGRTSPVLGVGVKGTVTVDWGDGTEPYVLTGNNASGTSWTPKHSYASAGDYIITLTVNGEIGFTGQMGHTSLLRFSNSSSSDSRNYGYSKAIRKVEMGNNVSVIGYYAFGNCFVLEGVNISNGATSIGESAFYACYTLESITIPDGVTSIGNSAFNNCYTLESVNISDSVTSIGNSAFNNCRALIKIRFNPVVPPTAANSSAFGNIPADCIISVPTGSLEAYTTATNYPNPATYTYIEED